MRIGRSCLVQLVVGLLVVILALPAPVLGGALSLGTARGIRAADLSMDGGSRWLSVAGRTLPVLDGSVLRSSAGAVVLDLADGSRVNLLPYSAARLRQAGDAVEVTLDYGRLGFRLPAATRVSIRTTDAWLEPVSREAVAGELYAGEATAVKMTAGRMRVRSTVAGEPALVASLDPVFVPARPALTGPVFASEAAASTAPAGSRGVFGARGESLGYLTPDGTLVVQPGFTADLTSPFAPRTVQVALAQVPAARRADAEPLFDVNGAYVGFVAGPQFFAQVQPGQAPGTSGAAGGDSALTGTLFGLGAILGVGALGLAAAVSNDSEDRPATPTAP